VTKRVLIAGLFHETHTFLPERTGLEQFEVLYGESILSAEHDASPLAGALTAARQLKWQALPAIHMHAMPSGMVRDEVVECFWNHFRSKALTAERIDGIFLVLHGAMASESFPDVEAELLRRIRTLPIAEPVPIGGVVDLHANFSAAMAELSNGLVGYRENPHTDAWDAGRRAAFLLDNLISKGRPAITIWQHAGIVWPPSGTATGRLPMLALEEEARRLERVTPGLHACNVFAGFAFADTPDTGVSFTAIIDNEARETAAHGLQGLCDLALELRENGIASDMLPCEAFSKLAQHSAGPVLLVEPSDNVGGGAPGDGTALLHELVRRNVGSAVCIINDPQAVVEAQNHAVGSTATISVGGKLNRVAGLPVTFPFIIESHSNGKFELEDRHSHLASMVGTHIDMGPCAVLRYEGLRILLTSRKTPPFDLGQLRSQGIVPEEQYAIVVKAAVAHRHAYDPLAAASYTVETPGPCSNNLTALPYRLLRRPIYPLDT
jgi:microcystin degradation protein MlrC